MSLQIVDRDRRIIPRWRPLFVTILHGELGSLASPEYSPIALDRRLLDEKAELWTKEGSIESASELVSAALIADCRDEAQEAAHFILGHSDNVRPAASLVASAVLSGRDYTRPVEQGEEVYDSLRDARATIHRVRAGLISYPRNGLLWVDMARAYTMLGQAQKAARAIEIALRVLPNDRFVLRSAARLFVHVMEPDRAHTILKLPAKSGSDPWLVAAEVAVASVAGISSALIRKGRQLIENKSLSSKQTAELASALATVELQHGDYRTARRLFRVSLVDPTENALAQVGWAGRRDPALVKNINPEIFAGSHEAAAWQHFNVGEWNQALVNCVDWQRDEPFSNRPAELGSYIAAIHEDYVLCERFVRNGLRANPRRDVLLNNLAVALANQGRTTEAWQAFKSIQRPLSDSANEATLLATEGLLRFRSGDLVGGRALYGQSIEKARSQNMKRTEVMAALHLAREEVTAGSPEAMHILEAAASKLHNEIWPDAKWLLERLAKRAQEKLQGSNGKNEEVGKVPETN